FFDDEVTEFFSPQAEGKSVMFLVALGRPDRAALGLARSAPGEAAVVMCVASDRRQARVVLDYAKGLLRACPMLAPMIATERAEGIELTNGITIEAHTSSYRAICRYTQLAVVLDELAVSVTGDRSATPDAEVARG